MKKSNAIDIVIIWVDGNDLNWQKEKNKYMPNSNDDFRFIRYRDWENLKYIFRGIEKFAPWVNKVHFVSCGQIPEWLNLNNPKLHYVNHKDYIPKEYLPTFSANPIEVNLHRIEGLAEQFIYFNDDTFITNYVKEEDFFKDGKPCDAAIENPIVPSGNDIIDYILLNDMEILNKYFDKKDIRKKHFFKWYNPKYGLYLAKTISLIQWKKIVGMRYSHLPSSILKSTMEEIWKKEFEILDETSKNKFRSKYDVNQYLFTNWQMLSGNFVPRKCSIGKFFLIQDDNKKIIDSIVKQKYKMICLNDNSEINDFEKTKKEIIAAFEKILPDKSSFEK